jgi:hypothetical protein
MRMSSLAAALALLAPPSTTLMSAGCICTLVGFENGLLLDVDVPAEPAIYRIQVEADGEALELRYEVTAEGIQCLECMATGDRLRLSDSFRSHAQDLVVNIARADDGSGPERATVRVFRGTVLAAEDMFEPRYETDEPNGRGCGKHVHASATLFVP